MLALITPLLILGGLSLLGGGFDVEGRHLIGILAWLLVALVLISPHGRRLNIGRPFYLVAGVLLSLAAFAGISSLWSDAVSLSLTEAERVVAYLGFFTLGFLVCQTERQRQLFVEGLTLALALLLLVALSDRFFPGTGPIPITEGARLRFPLGYWNADGLVFGISVVLLSWMGRHGSRVWLRYLSVSLVPAAIVGLYLTYSRGGFVAATVAFICVFFLSRDRLWLVATTSVGVLCAIPVLKLIRASPSIAENLGGEQAPSEGRLVVLALLASMAVAGLLVWGLTRIARRNPAKTRRVLGFSRDRDFLTSCAIFGLVALLVSAILFGPKAWDSYSQGPIIFPDSPSQHLTQLSSNGRYDQNKIAIAAFENDPLLGIGAGTFRFEWAQERPNDLVVRDAHSLYLESFAELGVPGGVLVVVLVGSLLVLGFSAVRHSERHAATRAATVLAATAGMAVAFGIDWFWELGATGALLMLAGSLLVAQASVSGKVSSPARRGVPRAIWASLAAWLSIWALAVPALAEKAIDESASAVTAGRVDEAIDQAKTAQRLNPWSPAPHLQLGVIAQALGSPSEAIEEFTKAIELEPRNWRAWHLRMLAREAAGDSKDAILEDFEQARLRNPRAPELKITPESVPPTTP